MATQKVCPACGLQFEPEQDVVMVRDFETEEWAAGVRVKPDRGPGGGSRVFHEDCLAPDITSPPTHTKYGAFEYETDERPPKTHACAVTTRCWPVEEKSLCKSVDSPDDTIEIERFSERHELMDAVDCGICLRSLVRRL